MKILLIGPPASGKGTIGELLSEKLSIPLISGGALLREVPESHPRYEELHKLMDAGELAPSDLIAQLLKERISKEDCKEGYLLDGWARKMDNLEFFNPGFDLVFFLNVSDDIVLKRISGRRMCKGDGQIYNIYTLPKEELDKCEGGFEQRDDDKEDVVRNRIEGYKEETLPVIEYFKKQGNLVEVDAEPTPDEVFKNVCKALKID